MIWTAKSKLDNLVQTLIPPLLVILLTLSILEIFTDVSRYTLLIDAFDLFLVLVFIIDLYYRWFETPNFPEYMKKHWLDIIASIPFNLIFLGVDYLVFTRALKGVKIVSRAARFAKYGRFLKLIRLGTRAPRFLRMRGHVKKTKIRKVQPHEKQMKGVLSFRVILLVTINSIMGTGIWFLTAAGAKHAGPASLISWAILSLVAIYIAMCFSELTAMFPKAGGVYEFAKQSYGRFWSFLIGWSTSIAGSVTISMLLLGALQYLIPAKYSFAYVPVAILLILIFNYIAFKGMQTSTYMLVTFSLITLATVAAIIIPGFFKLDPSNFTPFFVFPTINIVLAIFFIAETFFGWESAIFLSAETKNPKKIMPKALIYGTIIIACLALLLSLTGIGAIPWEQFGESTAPLRDLGGVYFGGVGSIIFTLLVFTSIIGAVACWIVTAPRLLMSIAEDKLFFVQFAKIHPKYKSPYVSIIFQAVVISVLVYVGAGSYETLLHLLIPLILVIYSAVLMSVVILRFKKPNLQRPYKVPLGKVGPILTIIFMLFLLYMFTQETHGAFNLLRISGLLVALGLPAYFFIEIFYDDKYVKLRRHWLAKLSHQYNSLPLPKPTFNRILNYVGPLKKKSVILDYNCGTGSFTRQIIKSKLPFKKIHAVDQIREEIKVFKKYIPVECKKKILITYRGSWTIPKKIKKVDIFVSFNALGYIKDPEGFIKYIKKILNKNGKFCFHIHHHLLNVTPNAILIENRNEILKLFKKQKLKAKYSIKKKALSTHIFIYGKK